jgi:hypothetical protein
VRRCASPGPRSSEGLPAALPWEFGRLVLPLGENVADGVFGKERDDLLAGGSSFPYGLSHKLKPEGEIQMAYSLYDAAVTPCAQQLSALAGIIDKAAAHCAANKIEESVLLQDRLYPDMFCLARQIRQSADFAMNTGGRLAGVTPPTMAAVDDTSFAAAKGRVETALGFVKSLTRAQVDGAEGKVVAWTAGGNDRKLKGNDYLIGSTASAAAHAPSPEGQRKLYQPTTR